MRWSVGRGMNINFVLKYHLFIIKSYYPYMFIFLFQLATTLESLDKNDKIGCIVLTGGTRAFAGKF